MFIAIKVMLYLIAGHIFYNAGFNLDNKLLELITLMSVVLLMDIISFFAARHQLLVEMYSEGEDE